MVQNLAAGLFYLQAQHMVKTFAKGQNPLSLHQFPRSKSVTSCQLPRLREITGKRV